MNDTFMIGNGLFVQDTKKSASEEKLFDKDFDVLAMEAYQSQEEFNTFNAYSSFEQQNADAKIAMIRKLKHAMLNCSVESYKDEVFKKCDEESIEAGAQAEANGGKNNSDSKIKVDTEKLGEEKQNWFKKQWERIKNFFSRIAEWIVNKIKAFINWIKQLFNKQGKTSNEVVTEINEAEKKSPNIKKLIKEEMKKIELNPSKDPNKIIVKIDQKAVNTYVGKMNDFVNVCNTLNATLKVCSKLDENDMQLATQLNNFMKSVSSISPIKNVPTFSGQNVDEFGKQLKSFASTIKLDQTNKNSFNQYFFGSPEEKTKKNFDELYGDQYKTLLANSKQLIDSVEAVERNVNSSVNLVKSAAKDFDKVIYSNDNKGAKMKRWLTNSSIGTTLYIIITKLQSIYSTYTSELVVQIGKIGNLGSRILKIIHDTRDGAKAAGTAIKNGANATGKAIANSANTVKDEIVNTAHTVNAVRKANKSFKEQAKRSEDIKNATSFDIYDEHAWESFETMFG